MKRRTSAKAYAKLRISLRSNRQMDAIAEALQPELGHPANERARAMIGRRGRSLNLEFEADDSSSLRAIMSSYLRLVAASLNVADALIELDKPRSESR